MIRSLQKAVTMNESLIYCTFSFFFSSLLFLLHSVNDKWAFFVCAKKEEEIAAIRKEIEKRTIRQYGVEQCRSTALNAIYKFSISFSRSMEVAISNGTNSFGWQLMHSHRKFKICERTMWLKRKTMKIHLLAH